MALPVLRSAPLRPARDSLAPPDPLHELVHLQHRMSVLIGGDAQTGMWTPPADITENDDAYLVEIDLPGVKRRDVTVEVAGNELRITGRIQEKEKVGWLRYRTRRVGRFAYHTLLPVGVDADRIRADLTDGVLTVRLPKTDAARPRRIAVRTA
ncbi:Hsp20/alpha crystallin family protein [Nonomuraea sp. FMUSA5-5]|uniref:Hsp20/alpha crystallin family protein n=1 Tax=Nonomuraea composti TaxID=2720023 RepID=A0ABX1BMJ7_9ACTN|nr:Hsp20/alpha crystallin family protein [Nonomuraea sp. FMUSA5-5]NJP97021.1 Hsp20/alpha crystallin family protein [Nonomuraea sp. FMUSA5-5]